ncbi:hypothetical protein OG426_54885 (plasmid) [Streptomyces canus]|uniref:hypothetical protein n=1 Tax=Streptomyces canus TaxID=58343 RepID=UPI002F90D3F4|nr:hypothetical protein OG426_54885 [Streptomyces canus]
MTRKSRFSLVATTQAVLGSALAAAASGTATSGQASVRRDVHQTDSTVVHGSFTELRSDMTYTMAQLNQRTAEVVDEINKTGRPALITKYGRIVAAVHPLEGARIESLLISAPDITKRIPEEGSSEPGADAAGAELGGQASVRHDVHQTDSTVVHGSFTELRSDMTYTMAQLNQRTAEVVDEINKTGRPALITKYGRIVAAVHPLEGARIESLLISAPDITK